MVSGNKGAVIPEGKTQRDHRFERTGRKAQPDLPQRHVHMGCKNHRAGSYCANSDCCDCQPGRRRLAKFGPAHPGHARADKRAHQKKCKSGQGVGQLALIKPGKFSDNRHRHRAQDEATGNLEQFKRHPSDDAGNGQHAD